MPQAFISFRWLSVYDCTSDLQYTFAPINSVVFFLFIKEDNCGFWHIIVKIFNSLNVSDDASDVICNIQETLSNKLMTELGKNRKQCIVQKLFDTQLKTKLIIGLFSAVLPLLKECFIISTKPLIHVLHEKQ